MTFEELNIKVAPGKVRGTTTCPQCNETRQKHKNAQCLTYSNEPDNQWYKCHHCSFQGNLGSMERYEKVLEKSKMPKQLALTYSKEVREYFDRRGIDTRVALRRKVYEFTMAGKPILGFPFYIGHTLVNVKYLNIRWKPGDEGPKWWQLNKDYGTKLIPWGLELLSFEPDQPKIITWTEGEIDCLTWETCGYKNVLSVPQGAPNPDAKNFDKEFDYINDKYVMSVISEADLHIFSTDNDAPGRVLKYQLSLILGKEKCKYINYPIGYKDINEVFKGVNKEDKKLDALGKAGVDECYNNLSLFPAKGIISPMDVRDELEAIAANGFTKGLGVGIPALDDLFTLKRKHFTVVTGLPSSGKSTWVRWYLSEFTKNNPDGNIKWAMFTPENRPVSREQAKMAEVITGQSFRRGFKNSMSEDLRGRTMRYIQKHFFFIAPSKLNFESWDGKIVPDKVNTMDSLLGYLIYLKKTEGIFGFVIDAWNKIEHEQPKNTTETQFISQQLDYLINFCDVYDLHCILIAHPTKIEKQGINYRMPCLYDIKGSSSWKEKPDLGIILHRYINKKRPNHEIPEDATDDDKIIIDKDAPTIVNVEKVRFEELGRMGKVKMSMDFFKGGKFVVVEDKKAEPQPIAGALNPPKNKKDDDDLFGGNQDDLKDLPF